MALVTTPGASNANSYASLVEAAAYHAERLNASAWTTASDPTRESALIMAARLLDAMPAAWTGSATTDTQALGWPRVGMLSRNGFALPDSVVPQDLKNAQAEFARQLIEGDRLGDNDIVNSAIERVKVGPIEVAFRATTAGDGLVTDAPTAELAGALFVPDLVKVMLVPSWLLATVAQAIVSKRLIFETL